MSILNHFERYIEKLTLPFFTTCGNGVHPRSLTWNLNRPFLEKEKTSTNHQFLGSMLVFEGVKLAIC